MIDEIYNKMKQDILEIIKAAKNEAPIDTFNINLDKSNPINHTFYERLVKEEVFIDLGVNFHLVDHVEDDNIDGDSLQTENDNEEMNIEYGKSYFYIIRDYK